MAATKRYRQQIGIQRVPVVRDGLGDPGILAGINRGIEAQRQEKVARQRLA